MFRRSAALALAFVGVAALAAPPATAATPADLYVDQSAKCQDGGPGTADRPFCSVQAAADVALPGQTVIVWSSMNGPVNITHSGTPDAPITFLGSTVSNDLQVSSIGYTPGGLPTAHGITMTGVHDVVIDTLDVAGKAGAIVVDNSSHVTFENDRVVGYLNPQGKPASAAAGISLTGGSNGITISRSEIAEWSTAGVSVGARVTATTITANQIYSNFGPAVVTADAPGTVITSNTMDSNCVSGIVLGGASTGSTVENNVLNQDDASDSNEPNCQPHRAADTGEIVVAGAAADRSVVDYNVTHTTLGNFLYGWGGAGYSSLADFRSATGQGTHDINADPKLNFTVTGFLPTEGSPVIDSADSTAPGELPTDYGTAARVDDPLVGNSGSGIADRGASEFQDPVRITGLDATPDQGPFPLPVTFTTKVDNPWSTPLTYDFSFDDGNWASTSASPTVQHSYTEPARSPASYTPMVWATLPSGAEVEGAANVRVTAPGPVTARLQANQVSPLDVAVDASTSADPWRITEYDIDFGDGAGPAPVQYGQGDHKYAAPGTYTIQLTLKDAAGNTATDSKQLTVGGAYYPAAPWRLLDTRTAGGPVGPGGETSVQVAGQHGLPGTGVTALVLNVTATDTTADSFLSVYPSGSPRPTTSNVNFGAAQTVSNLVTVPVGADGRVVIANHTGSVDVVADVQGYYSATPQAGHNGSFLQTTQPHRIMDTRDGTGGVPVASVGSDRFQALTVPGATYASAVVLNVTVTNPTVDGFLTVYATRLFPDDGPPAVSNLNFRAGQTVSNLVVVPVGANGKVSFYNHVGNADVVVDMAGQFVEPKATDATASFTPVAPARMLDTRDGTGGFAVPIRSNETIGLAVAGVNQVPAHAKSVVLNVTVVNGTANSFLTVFPDGARPATSNINFGRGQVTQGQVIVPIGPDHRVDFYNLAGTVDVVADVFGYFA